ncbi:MAG: hypothetical protein AAGJ52_04730, partial [Pseudomonadota bacterium]
CWNFLNYFSADELKLLMGVLIERLGPKGKIHALIESSATQMAANPIALSLVSGGSVRWRQGTDDSGTIPAPRHSTETLLRSMPGFGAEQTLLLANGQKELLFTRR